MEAVSPALGVCYYPEHWPEAEWPDHARAMVEAGLTWVRIGEFAWSVLEPVPGELRFDWLDRAIAILREAGLKIVLGTPTATPPRWMLDRHADMLGVDAEGRPRTFGSRRHYCFSHKGYRDEAVRICRLLGERYGRDPRIQAWQIDNEYACHDTTLSYSDAARQGFQSWLAERYGQIDTLNAAWGNRFWSMEYTRYDQIDLPNLTVTQANPSHEMAFRRFSSDQVVAWNRAMADALRPLTDAPLIHNYMGRELSFDHFAMGRDLDVASWDSYPIGFLSDRIEATAEHKAEYLQQGDPDMQAFHHDLYRSVGRGRWWVMEQQPGPVNWAPWNPAPLPGMVRLWSLEAVAHGAEVVSYFRWRQVPQAQEQMHAGLLRFDGTEAEGLAEARQVAQDLAVLGPVTQGQGDVALVVDYASAWAWDVLPQGADFDYFRLVFAAYRALRRAGLSVDIVPPDHRDFAGYGAVLIPGLLGADAGLVAAAWAAPVCLIGPRSFGATAELGLPPEGAPLCEGLGVRLERCESLPPDHLRQVQGGGHVVHWFEQVAAETPLMTLESGGPVLAGADGVWYLAGWPDAALWDRLVARMAETAGFSVAVLPDGVRVRRAGALTFAVNYSAVARVWNGVELAGCGVAVWRGDTRLL